jgi:hypothetical protein
MKVKIQNAKRKQSNSDLRTLCGECRRAFHSVIHHQAVCAFRILNSALRSLYHVSGGNFEDGRKAARLACGAGPVFHPDAACSSGAAWPRDSFSRFSRAHFVSCHVLWQLHDEAVLHQADKQLPAGVTGRQAEHAADAKAAMMLDEFREEWLQIGSKRNRH